MLCTAGALCAQLCCSACVLMMCDLIRVTFTCGEDTALYIVGFIESYAAGEGLS